MKKIIDKVAHDLGDGVTQERLFAQKTAFVAHIRSSSQRRFKTRIAIVTAGVVAAAGLLFALLPREPKPLPFTVGHSQSPGQTGQWVTTGNGDNSRFVFPSGSRIEVRAKTQTRIARADSQQVNIDLHHGVIEADIVGNGSTRWRICSGDWRITVLGTRFSVNWEENNRILDVTVFRGKVRVDSEDVSEQSVIVAGGNRFLATPSTRELAPFKMNATQLADASPRSKAAKPEKTTADTSDSATPDSGPDDGSPASNDARPNARKSSQNSIQRVGRSRASSTNRQLDWLVHYAAGNYKDALSAATNYGIDNLIEELDAVKLWKLQDAARITRRYTLSAKILHRFRERFPTNRNARMASFLLGRIAMDKKQFSSAAQWFNTYIREDAAGPLSEEAHGLLIVVYEKMGNSAQAKLAAKKYLRRYGEGAFVKIAQSQLN